MKYALALMLCAVAPVLVSSTAPTQEPEQPTALTGAEQLAAMTWLEGAWECEIWGGRFQSTYGTPEGGVLLSASKLLVKKRAQFFEFELFLVREGTVLLVPHPEGEAADPFELSEFDAKARKAVFENPANDFPTRITYHRESDERLVITLDDPHHGTERRDLFEFEPVD
ncbi:DUF6265 family protein [Engelhardtia mirabilis]|uniref:DUF6265 domain-containing protein n=1 Tax=Engelhardtia mirabilis TaxID=2528011 RepID=A0A518BN70_9BACT|nr:hypothetical protein Pla133_35210 [Planctomycetes bacterium Pla133]QDV02749.1 hypothetical protein Pla86_35190 [Planctomycetes bacterium Pla86]